MAKSSQKDFLKICIKGSESKISYAPIPYDYSDLLFETIKTLIPDENLSKIRVYWIGK